MKMSRYLPSAQFMTIVGSLFLSAGFVYAAQEITHRNAIPPSVSVASTDNTTDWQATLDQIQAQSASAALPTPDPEAINKFLTAAQSSNLTDTIGKTLFVNLSAAKSQGLGGDIPTQDQILAAAAAQIATQGINQKFYSLSDLSVVAVSHDALHDYGNAIMQTLAKYPEASERATFLSIDYAVEAGDKTQGAKLAAIGAAYKGAANALRAVPVPQTLSPFHLKIINNLLQVAATYDNMQTISLDPIRGLKGLQTYESLMDEGARVFAQVAQSLNKEGILFSKDEPGSAWAVFLSQ